MVESMVLMVNIMGIYRTDRHHQAEHVKAGKAHREAVS
jgi:hypothetical protein